MSLYRESQRRRNATALAVGAALLVGLVAGAVAGRMTASTPSLADRIGEVQERTRPVVQGLELVRLHYGVDRAAAVAQAERARNAFDDVSSDLRALDGPAEREASRRLDETVRLVSTGAPRGDVVRASARARAAVRAAAHLRDRATD